MSPRSNEYASIYTKWGWRIPKSHDDFPFHPQPPIDNPMRLARFFSGREAEVKKARDKLFDGNNVMVRGQWGIGKSAFILTVLQQLAEDFSDVQVLPLYIHDFSGGDCESLYRRILLALAKGLLPVEKIARDIYQALTGESVSVSKKRGVKYGFNVQVIEASGEIGEDTARVRKFEPPKHHIDDLLERASKRGIRVFIALDDLDKQKNQAAVWQMLNDAKSLLRNSPCKFILTGRPLIAGYEDFSAQVLELYDETFRLSPLDEGALKQATLGQLNLIRKEPRSEYSPFLEETITRIIPLSCGIPRQFNRICRHVLETARANTWELITPETFDQECLPELQNQISLNVPYQVRRLLYYIQERDGVSLANDDQVDGMLRVLKMDTLGEAIPFLNDYVRGDLIVPIEDEGKTRLTIAPLARQAAESGKSS